MRQPSQINLDKDCPEIQKIKQQIRENKDLRMHERYQTILMHLHDAKYAVISKIVSRSTVTVGSYIKSYKQGGIAALKMEFSTGRKRQLTPEQEMKLYQVIVDKTPVDVGFQARMNWTAPFIRKCIEQEFNVTYSEKGTRDLLYRLKLSFSKPTYTLAKADPVKQEAFKAEFFFEDESMIRDYQALTRTWIPKGK